MSYADANQVKLTQAHQMPKKIMRKPGTPWPGWPSATSCTSWRPACAIATTKHRSKKSSRGVAARWRSVRGRSRMRRGMGRLFVRWWERAGGYPVMRMRVMRFLSVVKAKDDGPL